jgi:hypothetical protein
MFLTRLTDGAKLRQTLSRASSMRRLLIQCVTTSKHPLPFQRSRAVWRQLERVVRPAEKQTTDEP